MNEIKQVKNEVNMKRQNKKATLNARQKRLSESTKQMTYNLDRQRGGRIPHISDSRRNYPKKKPLPRKNKTEPVDHLNGLKINPE
jgi:hypothetical protein